MKIRILILFTLTSFVVQSQSFVSSVKLGYDLKKGIRIGKWEEVKEKDIIDAKYKYKAFKFNYVKRKTGDDLKEFNYRGGKIYTLLYLFYDNDDRIVAIREYSKVKFSGSNGLTWFLNNKKRLKDYVSRIPEWKELDDVENDNLRRYYSIFIKEKESSKDLVQVYSINKDFTVKEYYYAKSNYQSINWVSNPYQKVKKLSTLFDENEVWKMCMKVVKLEPKAEEICSCTIKGMKKSLKDGISDLDFSNLYSDSFSKCFSNTNYFESKRVDKSKTSKKPQVYYQTIVNLNLRTKPKTDSKVLIMIPKLEAVFSREEFTDFTDIYSINEKEIEAKWVKVVYGKFEGWLFMGGLKPTDSEHYADQEYYKQLKRKKQ